MKSRITHRLLLGALLIAAVAAPAWSDSESGRQALIHGDYATALSELEQPAAEGDPRALYLLGLMHASGLGVPKDLVKGAELYREAAERGQPDAQYSLGYAYALGEGVPKDFVKSYKWLYLAAKLGHAQAKQVGGIVSKGMTEEQRRKARKLARDWQPKE